MCRTEQPRLRVRLAANPARCETCPPDRVCAWDCEQGLSLPDIENGAVLLFAGKLDVPVLRAESDAALWARYNAPRDDE